MEFPKLLLHIDIILATITNFCIANDAKDPKYIYRIPTNSIPVDYNISLIIPPDLREGNTFHGETIVTVKIVRESFYISLHSQGLEINETATTLMNDTIVYKPMAHTYDNETNILSLHFEKQLYRGSYTLNMKFAGNFSQAGVLGNGGFIKIPYTYEEGNSKYNRTLAATHLMPNKARRMFPCWDEPAIKAYFMISVMHHRKYTVLSNWPIREQYKVKNDMKWTHFDRTFTMSAYLVGIVIVSNFTRIENKDKSVSSVSVWCKSSLTSQAIFMHIIAEQITPLLEEYTDRTKGVPKVDHVIVPNYPLTGMGDWGIIIYDESEVVYDDSKDPTFQRRKIASLVAHEIAHQWFGNFITPSWWPDLWLSEGFAVFFQVYFLNKTFEDWRPMDFFVTGAMHDSLYLDDSSLESVTLKLNDTLDYNQLFGDEVYKKAPAILRMLYHAVGDEVFRKGITKYFATKKYMAVTPDDFWSAIQSAKDEASYVPSMRDQKFRIKEVMDTWIVQNRYPVLNVTMNYETAEVAITQKCFHATEDINNKWWIPISYTYQDFPYFSNTMPNNWLKPDEILRVQIITRGWIIVNLQQTAYCRVYYDTAIMERIIRYLNSEEYKNIHVLNRAQIINDAFAFLLEDQLDSSVFINIISYLEREKDYVAWRPMFRILGRNEKYFSLPESKGFKSHMVGIFDKLLEHVGYEENPDDDYITKMLRLDATHWACTVGHAECKRRAAVKLSEHFADPETHKVPQWWHDWTYCFGLAVANKTTWDKMMELYQRTSDKKFWKILSCSEDPDIIISYLNIIAYNTTLFNHEQQALIFNLILENHARNDLVLDYILANFVFIYPRLFPTSLTIKNIISNVFSNEQMSKVKRFAETFFHQDPNGLSNYKIINLIENRKNNLKVSVDIFTKRFGRNQT
ncbi:aminopeptidase N-like [Temnothorax longispinosus]|uniref:aminopeptidase N-like n=1 Tax=Temnothorax longispinosus TaxID=300112 RepID=UPI003A9978B7